MNRASMLIAALAFLSGFVVNDVISDFGGDSAQVASSNQTGSFSSNVESAPAVKADLELASSQFGSIVTDKEGRTLYVFGKDTSEVSTCYDACELAWPPVLADSPVAGAGIDASLVATSERKDGTKQITLGGKPLYRFAQDAAPGETKGQGNKNIWWVVKADGTAIKTPATGGAATGGAATGGAATGGAAAAKPAVTAAPKATASASGY